MFGFGDHKKIKGGAEEFVAQVGVKADTYYKQFVHHVAPILVDMGLTAEQTQTLLGNSKTKYAFTAGMLAEQLLAARNVMGSKTGPKFEKAVFARLDGLKDPLMKAVFQIVPHLLEHCRIDPMNSRIHTLSYMLMLSDLENSAAARKLEQSPLHRTMIDEIILREGPGIIQALAPKHGLASQDWAAGKR